MNTNKSLLGFGFLVVSAAAAISCTTAGAALAGGDLRDHRGGYAVDVLVDGHEAPTFDHAGEHYVMGVIGERYVLRVHNRTNRRVEAVVSVDGLDVVDGKVGSFDKRGYLVPAWGSVDIDGWRLSNHQVAAFRFSSVESSYAGRTGKARNVGVIGVAVFPERVYQRPLPLVRPPWHGHRHGYGGGATDKRKHSSGDDYEEAPRSAPAPARSGSAAESSAPSLDYDAATGGLAEGKGRSSRHAEAQRPGLGTEFGEEHGSSVHEVAFVRANASHPAVILGTRYDDRDGLYAMGIDVDAHDHWSEADLRQTARPFPVSTDRYARPPGGWRTR